MTQYNFDNDRWREWQNLMRKITELHAKQFQSSLAPAIKQVQETANRIAKQTELAIASIKPLQDSLNEASKKLNSFYAIHINKLQIFLKTLEEEVKEIPTYADKVSSYLASEGWFISYYSAPLSFFKEYSNLIDNKEYDIIEEQLQIFVKENFISIKKSVEVQFPLRYRIISVAFDAHTKQNYILSIPTLLAQADGMFLELLDRTFFSNKKKDLGDIKR